MRKPVWKLNVDSLTNAFKDKKNRQLWKIVFKELKHGQKHNSTRNLVWEDESYKQLRCPPSATTFMYWDHSLAMRVPEQGANNKCTTFSWLFHMHLYQLPRDRSFWIKWFLVPLSLLREIMSKQVLLLKAHEFKDVSWVVHNLARIAVINQNITPFHEVNTGTFIDGLHRPDICHML